MNEGNKGLRGTPPTGGGGGGARKLPAPVVEKILDLKRQNPWWGIKRISQVLRRMFLLKASPETVRKNLHEAQLMDKTRPKARRNMTRPRFFERATPNQLWQTDIFTFRLGGAVCLPDRLHGRLLAFRGRCGPVPQPDGSGGNRGLPGGGWGVSAAEGNAHRQRAAIHHLAGNQPL